MNVLTIAAIVATLIGWSHVHASGTNSGVPPSSIATSSVPETTKDASSLGYDDADADDNIEPNTYIVVFEDAESRAKIMHDIIGDTGNHDFDNSNIEVETESSMEIFDMETLRFGSEEKMEQWVAANREYIKQVCLDQNIADDLNDESYLNSDRRLQKQEQIPDNNDNNFGLLMVNAFDVSDENISNRKVCVVDSGYDKGNAHLPKQHEGWSAWKNVQWDKDDHGHGTHVAGIMVAKNDDKSGMQGVIRNGELPLFISKIQQGPKIKRSSFVIKGLLECVKAGANIINMSIHVNNDKCLELAIDRASKEDVLLIAAAGNLGNTEHATKYAYPASYDNVISVAAVNADKTYASFSQRNDKVDIAAPGVLINSTCTTKDTGLCRGSEEYDKISGTSMAAPFVSGVAALVWSHCPYTCSAANITDILLNSSTNPGEEGSTFDKHMYGSGVVNAERAYDYALEKGFIPSGPSLEPSAEPSTSPKPSFEPTVLPSSEPSHDPSKAPVDKPTSSPSTEPTHDPSKGPTGNPTFSPSKVPVGEPTAPPSFEPSRLPSMEPSDKPSTSPSREPSTRPTVTKSVIPSASSQPSEYPSKIPSEGPSVLPSSHPSNEPSISSQPSTYVSESNRPTIYTADIDYCKFKLENANARERVLEIVNSTESREGQVHKTSSKTVYKTTKDYGISVVLSSDPKSKQNVANKKKHGGSSSGLLFKEAAHTFKKKITSAQPLKEAQMKGKKKEVLTRLPKAKTTKKKKAKNPTKSTAVTILAQSFLEFSVGGICECSSNVLFAINWVLTEIYRDAINGVYVVPEITTCSANDLFVLDDFVSSTSSQENAQCGIGIVVAVSQSCDDDCNLFTASSGSSRRSLGFLLSNDDTSFFANAVLVQIVQALACETGASKDSLSVTGFVALEQPSAPPSSSPTNVPSESTAPSATSSPSSEASLNPTSEPSFQPSKDPSAMPSQRPSFAPSQYPSSDPSSLPTSRPSDQLSSLPSFKPSSKPSLPPSLKPSSYPSNLPTNGPSHVPSSDPTTHPTRDPSVIPSADPTSMPSVGPTSDPSTESSAPPSLYRSSKPSLGPTFTVNPSSHPSSSMLPSVNPSLEPSIEPSTHSSSTPSSTSSIKPVSTPSSTPSTRPSSIPSPRPTLELSTMPSTDPSTKPSSEPSTVPSLEPTSSPSSEPSTMPSTYPTIDPSVVPTALPSISSIPSSSPSEECFDSPSDWYDSGGSRFNCIWYGETNARCGLFGDKDEYRNAGKTANEVCCVCGGGIRGETTSPSASLSPSHSARPTISTKPSSAADAESSHPTISIGPSTSVIPTSSISPSIEPSEYKECLNSPVGWHDSDGKEFNCTWYASTDDDDDITSDVNRCDQYGDSNPNFGKTATDACCVCGGGISGPSSVPSLSSFPSISIEPSVSSKPSNGEGYSEPSQSPTETNMPTEAECFEVPKGWHDSDGEQYNCAWYGIGLRCQNYGDSHRNFGRTAKEACCQCGGGTEIAPSAQPTQTPSISTKPSLAPSSSPSSKPSTSSQPSASPSLLPSKGPSSMPSDNPSLQPSDNPSKLPSDSPSLMPSDEPSLLPSESPSDSPFPSKNPSGEPSKLPSSVPSDGPSDDPSLLPSDRPSNVPTSIPSDHPSRSPSDLPSLLPSYIPSNIPSSLPSDDPSASFEPSIVPSLSEATRLEVEERAFSDVWLKGQIGVHSERSLGELFHPPFLSDEGIEQVKNRARQYSYDGFYMYDQGGKTAAIFFVRENMKSASTLLGMERIPSTSINEYPNDTISYIFAPLSDVSGP